MGAFLLRIRGEIRDLALRTGHEPTSGHIGRDLWRQLCAESGCPELPAGALIEVDGCAIAYRTALQPTALLFDPPDLFGPRRQDEKHVAGWREQLIAHQWHEVGVDRWQRDGRAAVSMGDAIDQEVREAAGRAAVKRGEPVT